MSFFKPKTGTGTGSGGPITEADLPAGVRQKLAQIPELREIIENLEPSDGGDIDLGTFDNK